MNRRLTDVVVVVVWFLVLALVGAVLWWQLAEPPRITELDGQTVVRPEDLTRQVSMDGWYAVIALVGGLLSGAVLTAWRRRDPVLTVLMVTASAAVAAWVMERVGLVLGPDDPSGRLGSLGPDASVPVQLTLHAPGVLWLWPLAAAFGCLLWLWTSADAPREPSAAG